MINLQELENLGNVRMINDIHEEVRNNLILLYWPEKNLSQLIVKAKDKNPIHQVVQRFKGNKQQIFVHLLNTGIFKEGVVKVCSA